MLQKINLNFTVTKKILKKMKKKDNQFKKN